MADLWTKDRVLSLAPDPASAKAGQGQTSLGKWPTLGKSASVLWGEAQGSGKHPYQVRVDCDGPAFKCSCPSRKFPCKHALGLMLIFAEQPAKVPAAEPPAWVTEWIASRQQREETRAAKATERAAKPVDVAAQARRAEKREANVRAGIADLCRFLSDVVRQGLASAQNNSARDWDQVAARLVDAQAPGLARLVRELGDSANSGPKWQSHFLRRMGRLHLATQGSERLASLPPTTQADLRAHIGWTHSREELLALPVEEGTWCVVGQRLDEEDRLTVRRTWLLREQDGRFALQLEFAAANQPLEAPLLVGTAMEAQIVYYPGAVPLRAIVKQQTGAPTLFPDCPGHATVDVALESYATALAANPWIPTWPMALAGVIPVTLPDGLGGSTSWMVRDAAGDALPLRTDEEEGWVLAAVSGGSPITVLGEWDGEALAPLGVAADGTYYEWRRRTPHAWLRRVS